jgi:hypothetical protein
MSEALTALRRSVALLSTSLIQFNDVYKQWDIDQEIKKMKLPEES